MKFPMDRPVKVVMLGAGGTGGYVAPYHLLHHFSAKGVVFEIKLSPDCYEPILFGNTLIDMILYCQRDLRRLEEKQSEKKEIEIVREEAA